MDRWLEQVPEEIEEKYELHNINNAVEILSTAYPEQYGDILNALHDFYFTQDEIMEGGGNESNIPKRFSHMLRPRGWQEIEISGDLLVKLHGRHPTTEQEFVIEDFIDGHNIDYVKGKVAFDMEWNSKDQTFDRDLYAFRTFYECGIISCGVIVTRSAQLNGLFRKLGIMQKYGSSTTWIGKLLPRIQARRHGGCPILIAGITTGAFRQ